ncbi:MAG: hypothetical protein LBB45_03510 [Methanobrevibacter sp.]|jgi:hypothetical protein|nr:hypothetical protein [Candidatus Methanovirga basalitermitum]
MSNKYSKILISIAMLMIVSSVMSSCFAYNLAKDDLDRLNYLSYKMHGESLGDCWGCANVAAYGFTASDREYAYGLKDLGYMGAIVEGESDIGFSNHRAVVLLIGDELVLFESSAAQRDGEWNKNWFENKDPSFHHLKVVEKFNGYPYG